MELTWHKISDDGLPPQPEKPSKPYLVWWAYHDNGYKGTFDTVDFSRDLGRFIYPPQHYSSDPDHKITHWAEVDPPPDSDINPNPEKW